MNPLPLSQALEPEANSGAWRIAIVEDDQKLAQALCAGFQTSPKIESSIIFDSAEEFLERGYWDDFDLALIDIGLPGMSGLDLITELQDRCPALKTAVITVNEARTEVQHAIRGGARGYLIKTAGLSGFLSGVEALISGHMLFSPEVVPSVLHDKQGSVRDKAITLDDLPSPREAEVLALLREGFRRKEMAERLGISVETINSHIRRLYRRLGANGRREALVKADQLGL